MVVTLIAITSLLLLVIMFINMKKFMHILQQSFYNASEFFPAIKITKAYMPGFFDIILIGLGICSFYNIYFLVLYSFLVLYIAYNTVSHRVVAKKKFVYTTRVKITYGVISLLVIGAIALVYYLIPFKYIISIFVIGAMYKWIAIGFVILGNAISKPILNLLNIRYIKEAKDIINGNKDLKIIGITGSYGKTSTKNIVYSLLKDKYSCVMTPKSYNTTLGVVKTIREEIKPYTEVFVCEMGASRLGEIEEICKITPPDIAVITSIGPQHLTTFKTVENVMKGKYEIVRNSRENAVSILNIDNEWIEKGIDLFAREDSAITYSMDSDKSMYKVKDMKMSDKGSVFKVVFGKNEIEIETKLLGRHNIYNIVCGIAIARELGMTNEEIIKAAKRIKPVEHRLELKYMSGILALDDSFNSNPEGSKMAIETLNMFEDKYKVMVTPGMIELGDKTDELNKKFGEYASSLDFVILVGEVTTQKIKEGMEEKGFKNYIVVNDIYDAFSKLQEIQVSHQNLIALFENDLPDSYIK